MDAGDLPSPDLLLQRTAPNQGEVGRAANGPKCLPRLQEMTEVFLAGDPPNVRDQQIIRSHPQRAAILVASEARMEVHWVHSPAPQAGVCDAATMKVLLIDP